VRIELLGDEVESIREFDPASQRSQTPLGHVVAPPPRDLLPDRAFVIERSEALRALGAREGVSARAVDELVDSLLRGHVPPGAEALAPLLLPGTETVFDFLPEDTLVVIDDLEAGRQRMLRYAEESLENYELARGSGRLVCPPSEVALGPEALEQSALARRAADPRADRPRRPGRRHRAARDHDARPRRAARGARARAGERDRARAARAPDRRVARARYRIVLSAGSLSHAERLRGCSPTTASRRWWRPSRAVLALVGGRARRDPDRGALRGLHAARRPARARHRGGDLRAAREARAPRIRPGPRAPRSSRSRSSRRATTSCTPSTGSASTAASSTSSCAASRASSCASSTRSRRACSCPCTG
jgi:hypothetical protein